MIIDPPIIFKGNKYEASGDDLKLSGEIFGLTWNAVTEARQIVVSDDVKIHGEIQLIRQES